MWVLKDGVIRLVRIRLFLAAPVAMQLSLRYKLKAGQGTDNKQLKSINMFAKLLALVALIPSINGQSQINATTVMGNCLMNCVMAT